MCSLVIRTVSRRPRALTTAGHGLGLVEQGELGEPGAGVFGGGFLGEAGLAGAAGSGEGDEAGRSQVGTDGVEFGFPADERVEAWPQIAVALRLPGWRRSAGVEQVGVQGGQFGSGVGAEAVGEGAAGRLVGGERVGAAARVPQGADEQGVQRLVVRVGVREFGQLRYDVCGTAELQIGRHARACRFEALGLGAGRGGAVGEVGECGPAPQGERVTQGAGGGRRVVCRQSGRALTHEALEDVQVHVLTAGGEAVAAARLRCDGVLAEGAAELARRGLEGGGRVGRWLVGPHVVDERVRGGGPAGVQRE